MISNGQLLPGDRLPPVRHLMRATSLSNATVQRALRTLKRTGMIVSRPGAGLFVCEPVTTPEPDFPEVWVESLQWLQNDVARLLNRFSAAYPNLRVMQHAGNNDLQWLDLDSLPGRAPELEDLTDFVLKLYGRDSGNAALFDPLRLNGRLYMLPLVMNVQVMVCNLALFERRGLAPPSLDWNWDEFLAVARKLTDPGRGTFGFQPNYVWDFLPPLVWQAGGALFTEDGAKCRLDSPEAIQAARFLRAQHAVSRPADPDQTNYLRPFLDGRVAIMTTGITGYRTLKQAAGFRWTVRGLPGGVRRVTRMNALGYALSTRASNRAMARAFMTESARRELWPEHRQRPSPVPFHCELEIDGEIEREYRKALAYARSSLADILPERRTPLHAAALFTLGRYIEPLVHGQEPVAEIMKCATREIDALLSPGNTDFIY